MQKLKLRPKSLRGLSPIYRAQSRAKAKMNRQMRRVFGKWTPTVNLAMNIHSIVTSTKESQLVMSIDLEKSQQTEETTANEPTQKGNIANATSHEGGIDLPSMSDQAKSYWNSFKDSAARRTKDVQNRSAEETAKRAAGKAQKFSQEATGFLRSIFNNTVAATTATVIGAVKGAGMGISQLRVLADRLAEETITPDYLIGEWSSCRKDEDTGELKVDIRSEELPEETVGLGKALERELALPVPTNDAQGEGFHMEVRDVVLIPFRVEGDNSAFAILDNEQDGGPVYFWIDSE